MKTIDVGVITHAGGAHLDGFLGGLAAAPEVGGVALVQTDKEKIAQAKKLLGRKLKNVYARAEKMLRDVQPRMALVSMEPQLSPPAIDAALEAGCHVLTEKPACVRVEDFAKLVRKADSKHLHLMLALANRPHAPVQEARRIIRSGMLGKFYGINMHMVADQARLRRADYRNSWRGSKARAGGGMLIWLGIHWIDMALYLTGLQVQQVAGFTGVVGGQPIDVEDSAAISMQFNDGVLGTLQSGFYLDKTYKENIKRYHSHMQIWGEHGWLRLSTFEEEPLTWYSTRSPQPGEQIFKYPRGLRSYSPFVRQAVRASADLAPPPITNAECLHVLQTIFAAYTAAETRRTQNVGL